MKSSVSAWLRLSVLLSVLFGMPLLAVPQVRARAVRLIASLQPERGSEPGDVPLAPPDRLIVPAHPHQRSVETLAGERLRGSASAQVAAAPALLGHSDRPPASTSTAPTAALTNSVTSPGTPHSSPATVAGTRPPPSAAHVDASLEHQLGRLGASYLVVEHLEHSGLYRCFCLVQVPGTGLERPFEAEDLVADRALERVLAEVEHWALARQSATTASRHPARSPGARPTQPSPAAQTAADASGGPPAGAWTSSASAPR